MGKRLEQALAEADEIEAAEATAGPDAPIPAHVKVSRPGRARSRVLQVRLNPDEYEALEAMAERRGLPVSTVARDHLLRLIAPPRVVPPQPEWPVEALVAQLSATVAQLQQALPVQESHA